MNVIKALLGIGILPGVLVCMYSFSHALFSISLSTAAQQFFAAGLAAYLILFCVKARGDVLYVFGHEATHAVLVWVFGGTVSGFAVSAKSGKVKTDTTNILIELGPYLFPFYTVLCGVLFFVLRFFVEMSRFLPYWMFFLGLTISFHILMTIYTARTRQQDFGRLGYLLSVELIAVTNVVIFALIIAFMFGDFRLDRCLSSCVVNIGLVYRAIGKGMIGIARSVRHFRWRG